MCRNPACKNYGIHYQGPAPVDREIVSDERYHFNANTGQFSCDYCAMASTSLNTTRTGRNPKIDFTAVMIRTRCCVGCVISGFKSVRRCTCHAKGTFLLHLAESNAACCPDMPTYALMINGGMIGNIDDKTGLHGIYRSFLQENDIGPDNDVRIIPMFTGDIVFAVASLITTNNLSFGSDKLVMIFDKLHEGLLQDELPEDHEWMSNVWIDVLTTRPTHDQIPRGYRAGRDRFGRSL